MPTSAFRSYAHLITTNPHKIEQIFISDLHLSNHSPAQEPLVQAFLCLLDDLLALPNLQKLYILGDWFDAWIGDDAYLALTQQQKLQHWLTPIIQKLQGLHANGCQTFVMHGNRDFMLGQNFCNTFNGILINEPYGITVGKQQFRLEHGDALCTDDKAYQRFRKVIRNPLVKWLLLKKPLHKRLALAQNIKQKSAQGKANKSAVIMDVNAKAVADASKHCDALLHGHTHRPAIHNLKDNKTRYVLGDWRVISPDSRQQRVEAVIGAVVDNKKQNTAKISGNHNRPNTDIKNTKSFQLINFVI